MTTRDRLKEIMEIRQLKQKDIYELAQPYCKMYDERLGIADISAYCTGKYLPAQKKLALLAMALNVSEAWLMGFDVPMDRQQRSQQQNSSEALNAPNDIITQIVSVASEKLNEAGRQELLHYAEYIASKDEFKASQIDQKAM